MRQGKGRWRGWCWGAVLLLPALACSDAPGDKTESPLAPGGSGGGGAPEVPPPIVHAPPEDLAAELLGPELGAPGNVRDVSVDRGGGVWVAAAEGLFVRPPGGHFFEALGAEHGLPAAEVDSVGGLESGLALVSFLGGAAPMLVRIDDEGKVRAEPRDLNRLIGRIRTVDVEGERFAALATGGGLAVIDGKGILQGTRSLPEPTVELWDVALTAAGDAWTGDLHRLARIEGPVTQTLAGQVMTVLDLVPDESDDIVAVEVCPNGDVWASALGKGVFHLSPEGRVIEQLTAEEVLPQDHVPTLACDPDGSLWIGTSWGGVVRRLPSGTFRYHSAFSGLAGDSVRRLLVVPDDAGGRTLWIATDGGLMHYTGS